MTAALALAPASSPTAPWPGYASHPNWLIGCEACPWVGFYPPSGTCPDCAAPCVPLRLIRERMPEVWWDDDTSGFAVIGATNAAKAWAQARRELADSDFVDLHDLTEHWAREDARLRRGDVLEYPDGHRVFSYSAIGSQHAYVWSDQ